MEKNNKVILAIILGVLVFFFTKDFYAFLAIFISTYTFLRFIGESNNYFIFKEWVILLYSLNYLISPLIAYKIGNQTSVFEMKIPFNEYFSLAIPGMLLFILGLNIIPTRVFHVNNSDMNNSILINSKLLVKITLISILMRVLQTDVDNSLRFIFYLISLIRYVGSFSLYSINPRKNWFWPLIVLGLDFYYSLVIGMYHDFIMWLVFFLIYVLVIQKPSFKTKAFLFILLGILILFFQSIKFTYRQKVWSEGSEANLAVISEVSRSKANTDSLVGLNNLISMLNRGNQAWIFASTVDNLNASKNFQGMTLVNRYFEAAILPRFIAPNKIESGSSEIFNEYSGHIINENTSMGLGIFADGYIAYGAWGVYIFGFALGLIFSLTFKLVERWTIISPFYVLLLLPLLNYAVRPDCELQTSINHLFKGILLYGFLVYLTRKRFTLNSAENKRKLMHLNLALSKK